MGWAAHVLKLFASRGACRLCCFGLSLKRYARPKRSPHFSSHSKNGWIDFVQDSRTPLLSVPNCNVRPSQNRPIQGPPCRGARTLPLDPGTSTLWCASFYPASEHL